MIKRLMNRFRRLPETVPVCAPDRPLAVIGDVHGRLDLLERLLDRLSGDADLKGSSDLVLVGDLVDRGPDSAGVIDLVRTLETDRPDTVTTLMGNHEAMMLDFLDDPDPLCGANWLRHGGEETLQSLGLELPDMAPVSASAPVSAPTPAPGDSADDLAAFKDIARAALGADRLAWVASRPLVFTSGDVIAVHGAYDRTRSPEDQDPMRVLWGSREFYRRHQPGPPWVVHGHVITRPPEPKGGRIPVDSGAWLGGGLTAAVILPGAPLRYVRVDG